MTPSLLAIRNVKSMLTTLEPRATRKVNVGDDVNLEINAAKEESVATLIDYYYGLRILANASAFSGNYTVDSKVTNGTKVMFARLDVNLCYADAALRKAMLQGGGELSRLRWIEEQDTLTRGLMVTYMRQGWPQSEALTRALNETSIQWNSLVRETGREPPSLHSSAQGPPW
jgi:hypothetical protein